MSEIPFVNRLGDALDVAMAAERGSDPMRRRRRSRRGLIIAAAAVLCAGGGVAVAELLSDPTRLATTGVSCYETADLDGGTSVIWAGDQTPTEACADVVDVDEDALVACAGREGVVVFPGTSCGRANLQPLSSQYATERERVAQLERDLIALEDSVDCIEPEQFARRVEALLRRHGWTGWRPWLREDLAEGPCGAVSERGGNGERTIAGALDADGLRVMVIPGPHRSTEELLFAPGGAGTDLVDASGERCHTEASLREMVRRRFEETGRAIDFTTSAPENGVTVEGSVGDRLAEGCAVITAVSPAEDGVSFEVQIWQRG